MDKLFAFVLMPFEASFDDVYRFGIKEPASKLDIVAERVDEQLYSEGILDRIYRQIEAADIIVADMTSRNANVFYEVGYAHAKDKLCVLATSDANDIPFDLKHRRHIVYEGSIKGLAESMIEELTWAKKEIGNIANSRIKVHLQETVGELDITKYSVTGTANFKIDLTNDSDASSPEIEALYFYSTKGWEIFQNEKACPSYVSDISAYELRHFLTPPVRILHKDSWAQLQFLAKRKMASVLKGEPLKDSYHVRGHSVLRLVTSKGNFDYALHLDIPFFDLPF